MGLLIVKSKSCSLLVQFAGILTVIMLLADNSANTASVVYPLNPSCSANAGCVSAKPRSFLFLEINGTTIF